MQTRVVSALLSGVLMLLAGALSGCSKRHVTTTATGKTVYGEKAEVVQRLQEAGSDLQELMNAPDSKTRRRCWIAQNVSRSSRRSSKAGSSLVDNTGAGWLLAGPQAAGVILHSLSSPAGAGERKSDSKASIW